MMSDQRKMIVTKSSPGDTLSISRVLLLHVLLHLEGLSLFAWLPPPMIDVFKIRYSLTTKKITPSRISRQTRISRSQGPREMRAPIHTWSYHHTRSAKRTNSHWCFETFQMPTWTAVTNISEICIRNLFQQMPSQTSRALYLLEKVIDVQKHDGVWRRVAACDGISGPADGPSREYGDAKDPVDP
jgi:hypothetical protein